MNQCGIVEQRKKPLSNRGRTVLFKWSQLGEGCVSHLLSLSSIFENALWKEGAEV